MSKKPKTPMERFGDESADLTESEEEFSDLVGHAMRVAVKGALELLRERIKNGKVRPQVGQAIMVMQMATGSATVAYQLLVSAELMKQCLDQAYLEIVKDEQQKKPTSHHEPGNA